MNCTDLETLLCDYVDGTLPAGQKAGVERHLAACAACAERARDAAAALAFVERVAEVELPPQLLTRILYALPAAREAQKKQARGLPRLVAQLFRPMLQPRFAMGFAMTILSFSMLGKFAGISLRQLTPADLNPVKLWQGADDRLHRAWDRTVKFYESLRLVYEIQTRIREWTEQDQRAPRPSAAEEQPAGASEKPSGGTRNGEPRPSR